MALKSGRLSCKSSGFSVTSAFTPRLRLPPRSRAADERASADTVTPTVPRHVRQSIASV